MSEHTPGKWIAKGGLEGDDMRWGIFTDGPLHYHIATIGNGAPGDSCETEGHNAAFIVKAVNIHDQLVEALEPYQSGEEWGAWLAWIVEGAPTREQGIAAAKAIVKCQNAVDHAISQAKQP